MASDESVEKGFYLRKDGEEKMAGSLSQFKGREYFSLRTWYKGKMDDKWWPGKNGINLPMDERPQFLRVVIQTFGADAVRKMIEHMAEEKQDNLDENVGLGVGGVP